MKTLTTILILSLSFLLTACQATDFPKFPDVKYQYEMIPSQNVCDRWKVVSLQPYRIAFDKELKMSDQECPAVTGITLKDHQKILNFKSDVEDWFSNHKTCFNGSL